MTQIAGKPFSQFKNLNILDEFRLNGVLQASTNQVYVAALSDLPDPVLKDGVSTIILEDKEYLLVADLSSSFPLAFPVSGGTATWRTLNRAIWTYTGTDACFRDKTGNGNIELHGLTEFHATNAQMFDIDAGASDSWSFQAFGLPAFRNCKSIGTVKGGSGGNGAFNIFFGSITNFDDGLIAENLFFNEINTVFVNGNNNQTLSYDGQTANFTRGETVTGGTSGATGVVEFDRDDGVSGKLTLSGVTGTFQNNEALTGSSTGVAVVNGTIQNMVIFTTQGAATSGSINFLTITFFASANETLFDLKTEIQSGVDSINLRGNQSEGVANPSDFVSGSLDSKSSKVFSVGNTFFCDSHQIGSAFVTGNSNATTIPVNGTFVDFDLGTVAAGSNIERWALTNTTTGELRFDGDTDFSGVIAAAFSTSSTGGSQQFRIRFVKNGSVLPDAVETKVDIGNTLQSTAIVVPLTAVNGDLIRPQVTRVAGTSTITAENFSVNIE